MMDNEGVMFSIGVIVGSFIAYLVTNLFWFDWTAQVGAMHYDSKTGARVYVEQCLADSEGE